MAKRKTAQGRTTAKSAKRTSTKRTTAPRKSAKAKTSRSSPKPTPKKKTAQEPEGERGPSLLEDPGHVRQDLAMIDRALARRWPTDPQVMKALLSKVARHGLQTSSVREMVRCTEVYLRAEAQNQADQLKGIADKLVVKTETTVTPELQRQILQEAIKLERSRRQRNGSPP